MKRLHKIKNQLRGEARKSPRKGNEHSKWKKREKKKMGTHRRRKSRAQEELAAIAALDISGGTEDGQIQPAPSRLVRKKSRSARDSPRSARDTGGGGGGGEEQQQPQQQEQQQPQPHLPSEQQQESTTDKPRLLHSTPSLNIAQKALPTRSDATLSPRKQAHKSADDVSPRLQLKSETNKDKDK